MLHVIRYIAVIIAILAYTFWTPSENATNFVCFLAILLFGVPHGAIDHKIHQSFSISNNKIKFITRYVMIAVGYLAWWLFMPFKAFLIFILLSAYHFGQEMVEDHKLNTKEPIHYLVWGSLILIAPLLIHFNELLPSFEIMAGQSIAPLNMSVAYSVALIIFGFAILFLIYNAYMGKIQRADLIKSVNFILYISISYLFLPFIVAFTLYFVLFHSTNALRHQFLWFKKRNDNYKVVHFIKDLVPFTLLAFVGIFLTIYLSNPSEWASLFSYFFVFISVLTLPHALLFNQLYMKRKKINKATSS
ncbi:MAG: Brp/Blh family beta-carotene 15,15'-dioxygenase [Bacteroidota bacterium]